MKLLNLTLTITQFVFAYVYNRAMETVVFDTYWSRMRIQPLKLLGFNCKTLNPNTRRPTIS